jgi:hypothetical protein
MLRLPYPRFLFISSDQVKELSLPSHKVVTGIFDNYSEIVFVGKADTGGDLLRRSCINNVVGQISQRASHPFLSATWGKQAILTWHISADMYHSHILPTTALLQ